MSEAESIPELDPIVHGQLRLAVLSLLSTVDHADFKWLRDKTRSTDGNLGANLAKLEQAKYIAVTKKFIARKPTSSYRLTPRGRKALAGYVAALRKLLADKL
ncbi:MAG: transcriptional regulator [Verrucomicrobia bacterium]|nr:transcriptional regulator [Verrucomicrobiota bacterium]